MSGSPAVSPWRQREAPSSFLVSQRFPDFQRGDSVTFGRRENLLPVGESWFHSPGGGGLCTEGGRAVRALCKRRLRSMFRVWGHRGVRASEAEPAGPGEHMGPREGRGRPPSRLGKKVVPLLSRAGGGGVAQERGHLSCCGVSSRAWGSGAGKGAGDLRADRRGSSDRPGSCFVLREGPERQRRQRTCWKGPGRTQGATDPLTCPLFLHRRRERPVHVQRPPGEAA